MTDSQLPETGEELDHEMQELMNGQSPDALGCYSVVNGHGDGEPLGPPETENEEYQYDPARVAQVGPRRMLLMSDVQLAPHFLKRALSENVIAPLEQQAAAAGCSPDPTATNYCIADTIPENVWDQRLLATGCMPWELTYEDYQNQLHELFHEHQQAVTAVTQSAVNSAVESMNSNQHPSTEAVRLAASQGMSQTAADMQGACEGAGCNTFTNQIPEPIIDQLWNRMALHSGSCVPLPSEVSDCSVYGDSALVVYDDTDNDGLPDGNTFYQLDYHGLCLEHNHVRPMVNELDAGFHTVIEQEAVGRAQARLRRRLQKLDGDGHFVHPEMRRLAGLAIPWRDDFGRRLSVSSGNFTHDMVERLDGNLPDGTPHPHGNPTLSTYHECMHQGVPSMRQHCGQIVSEIDHEVQYMQEQYEAAAPNFANLQLYIMSHLSATEIQHLRELIMELASGLHDNNSFKQACGVPISPVTTLTATDGTARANGINDNEEFAWCLHTAVHMFVPLTQQMMSELAAMSHGESSPQDFVDHHLPANTCPGSQTSIPTACYKKCAPGFPGSLTFDQASFATGVAWLSGWHTPAGWSDTICTQPVCENIASCGDPGAIQAGIQEYNSEQRRRVLEERREKIRQRRRRLKEENQNCMTIDNEKFCEVIHSEELSFQEDLEAKGMGYLVPALSSIPKVRAATVPLHKQRRLSGRQLSSAGALQRKALKPKNSRKAHRRARVAARRVRHRKVR
jgi:hypothetical protein